jgi:SAM-dependent methyltransferase
MKNNIYSSGEYLINHPDWDSKDSLWKAKYTKGAIEKNGLHPKTVCEIGCGAGEILKHLKRQIPENIKYCGYDISPQAHKLCLKNPEGIEFRLADFTKEKRHFDLILLIDVIEHIDGIEQFLSSIKGRAKNYIFYVPLDLCLQNVVFQQNLIKSREINGHLHFFSKCLAFKILRDSKYKIIDYSFTPAFSYYRPRSVKNFLGHILRKTVFLLSRDLAAKIFNGFSIMIYCQ